MPIGFTQTAERLSDYGKVRDYIEPASTLPSSDRLAVTLSTQLAALSQPAANDNTPQDSIADDLSQLVAQLRAMSFARKDVADVADNTFDQTPALGKLADGLSLSTSEIADSANALNEVSSQLAEIQAADPITVGDLTDGYLQAIENASSTQQQSILLKQLASLGDNTMGNADDLQAIRILAEQDARINVHQTKQLNDVVKLLRDAAVDSGILNRNVHEVLTSSEDQALAQRHHHEAVQHLGEDTLTVAEDQLAQDQAIRDEQNKQRDFDMREEAKEKSKQKRAKKRNSKGQFGSGDDEKGKKSFLTKVMTGDIAGLREEALGAVLGTVGFEDAASEVSDFIEDLGEKRKEAEYNAEATGKKKTKPKDSKKDDKKDDQLPDADFDDKPTSEETGMLREFGSRAFTRMRSEVISAALGSIGLEGAAEEVDQYLEDKKKRHEEAANEPSVLPALPAPKRVPLTERLLGSVKQDDASADSDVPTLPSTGSSVTSSAHIDGLNAGQSQSAELDLFAPKDRTQERTLAALEDIASNSAKAAQDAAEAVQSVTNNSNVTNVTNNDNRSSTASSVASSSNRVSNTRNVDNRRAVSGSKSIANYNNAGTALLPSQMPRASKRNAAPVLALPAPTDARRTSVGSQRKAKGQLSSSAASIAVGTTNRKPDLMTQPTPQQQGKQDRKAKREGNPTVAKKAQSLSPMMQVATNPLAGREGEALVASTLKLNKEEMDVIDQEGVLIKDMRKTLKRVEGALPDDSILGSLMGGGSMMGGLADMLGVGELFDMFTGGDRKNSKKDRVSNKDVDKGRRGRRGGTRGGRVRSALGNMAQTAKAAIGGVVSGVANMATGGGGSLLESASDMLGFGGGDRGRDRRSSRNSGRKKGGLRSRIGGAVSGIMDKGKGFIGNVASKGAGLLRGAGGLAGGIASAGGLAGAAGGIASGAGSLLKGAGSLAKGVLGKVPLLAPLMAAYDGFNGWNNADANFDIAEGQEATTGQKMSSALGSIASGLSFGLLDEGSMSRGIHSVGSTVSDLGNSAMNALTFGLWGSNDDDEEEAAKSATAKIAKTSAESIEPTDDEFLADTLPSIAKSGALTGAAAMTGINLAKDDAKEVDLFKPRDKATKAIAQQSTKSLTPSVGGSSAPLGVGRTGDSPSMLSRITNAAQAAATYTPMGLAATGLTGLASSVGGFLGLGLGASDDTPQPKSAADAIAQQSTQGLLPHVAAALSDGSDVTGKVQPAPSLFSRLKDAASTTLSYSPLGMAYSGLSNLTSASSTGAVSLNEGTGKAKPAPSLFSRLKDAASAALSYTPLGMAASGASSLLGSETSNLLGSGTSSIASKDGTFFNPALSAGGTTDQLFMGDNYVTKGGLSAMSTIAGASPDLTKLDGIAPEAQAMFAETAKRLGLSTETSSVSKVANLSSYSNLSNIGGSTTNSRVGGRSISSMSIDQLTNNSNLSSLNNQSLETVKGLKAGGGNLSANVEMPPALRDEKLVSDTLMSPTVQAQLSGGSANQQGANRNNPNVVSASRPAPARRTTVSRPAPSQSGQSGSFHVDDTGIAIMNSIIFD